MASDTVHNLRSRYGPFDGIECTVQLDDYRWLPLYDPFWDDYSVPVRWR